MSPYLLKLNTIGEIQHLYKLARDREHFRRMLAALFQPYSTFRDYYPDSEKIATLNSAASKSVLEARKKIIWVRWSKYRRRRLRDWSDPKTLTERRRAQVYEYYKGICQICGRQLSLRDSWHIHHIDRNRRNNHLNNLILLCSSCHRKFHSGELALQSRHPSAKPLTQQVKSVQTSILSWNHLGGD